MTGGALTAGGAIGFLPLGGDVAKHGIKKVAKLFGEGAQQLTQEGMQKGAKTAVDAVKESGQSGSKASSKTLAKNMEAAGKIRGADEAVHHIAAGGHKGAESARSALSKEGVNINDAANGVFLPKNAKAANPGGKAVHSTVHTASNIKTVNKALQKAEPGTAREVLQDLGKQLEKGNL